MNASVVIPQQLTCILRINVFTGSVGIYLYIQFMKFYGEILFQSGVSDLLVYNFKNTGPGIYSNLYFILL